MKKYISIIIFAVALLPHHFNFMMNFNQGTPPNLFRPQNPIQPTGIMPQQYDISLLFSQQIISFLQFLLHNGTRLIDSTNFPYDPSPKLNMVIDLLQRLQPPPTYISRIQTINATLHAMSHEILSNAPSPEATTEIKRLLTDTEISIKNIKDQLNPRPKQLTRTLNFANKCSQHGFEYDFNNCRECRNKVQYD